MRKRGGSEVMVEVADIDWIEASGNYAILHVGGETFEIRSSLAKLEGELDPKRFVRVHKSHVVNIARVAEVDAVGERRLAHPPAGRRRGESEPPLSPALRGIGAGQELTARPIPRAGRPTDLAGRHKTHRNQRLGR